MVLFKPCGARLGSAVLLPPCGALVKCCAKASNGALTDRHRLNRYFNFCENVQIVDWHGALNRALNGSSKISPNGDG
jgi:hypothetical protein